MRAALSIFLALALAFPAVAQEEEPQSETEAVTPAMEDTTPDAEPPVEDVEPPDPVLLVIDAAEVTLEEFLWIARPIVVFADTPRDPRFQDQIDLLLERPDPLIERDVVVIIDADPDARSEVRLALRPRGFSLVILQRDGRVALRKPSPWDVRAIMRAIDNLPMRIEEMRQSR